MGGLRLIRDSRTARPMALVSAMATLLAALFLCLSATEATAGEATHHGIPGAFPAAATGPAQAGSSSYVCPYERGDCGLFPSLSPAVLTAPPLDPPLHADGRLPHLAPAHGGGDPVLAGARPRAPDLHVLQVLRT